MDKSIFQLLAVFAMVIWMVILNLDIGNTNFDKLVRRAPTSVSTSVEAKQAGQNWTISIPR